MGRLACGKEDEAVMCGCIFECFRAQWASGAWGLGVRIRGSRLRV